MLITGAGPIGLMAAAVVRHAGARHVVITDVNEYRLSLAGRVGVTRAVDIRPVITHHFDYADYEQAFTVAKSSHAGKVILHWSEG